MDVIDTWTGRHASALRAALRMTGEAFAEHLGAAPRTVANWDAKPEMVLTTELQRALDTVLEEAPLAARKRFALLLSATEVRTSDHGPTSGPTEKVGGAESLRVAIGVVCTEEAVLLVRRRNPHGSLAWQFPAGIVKPGTAAIEVVPEETFNETGIHCAVRRNLGSRIHPTTGVLCEYFLCDYLSGEAQNRDTVENLAVEWAARRNVGSFVPLEQIFEPVLRVLTEEDM